MIGQTSELEDHAAHDHEAEQGKRRGEGDFAQRHRIHLELGQGREDETGRAEQKHQRGDEVGVVGPLQAAPNVADADADEERRDDGEQLREHQARARAGRRPRNLIGPTITIR